MTNPRFERALSLGALSLAAILGCGGDLVLPTSSGEGVDLSILGGNGQTGTVGQELPEPLVVGVESGGAPVEGHQVAFVARWVLGTEPGPHEVEARLVVSEPAPPPIAVFEASAVAGEPDTVRAVSPVSQPGRIGQPTPEDPTVLVLDQFGNPVGGAAVDWDVTAGRGSVSSAQTETGTDGKATVTWTLGLAIGVQKLAARVEGAHGSPVTFTATVLF